MTERMKVAVIGTGHLGQAHARIYASLPQVDLVAVCDLNEAAGQAIADRHNTRFVRDYHELLDTVEAISVATPTITHHEITCACLQAGLHALVEKPIARTLAEADEMIALAAEKNLVLQVGHIERFNPAFTLLQQHIRQPYFFEAHRLGIFTPRSLDIDVVMDLMVHELDIISSFVPSEVVKMDAVGIPILTPQIDLANARVEFANGCVANITASRVSGERMRKLRVFQPNEYYSLDYAEQQVLMCKLIPPAPGMPRPEIVAQPLMVNNREPLLAEIEGFITAAQKKSQPIITGADARRALALAIDILDKIRAHSIHAGIKLVFDR